MPSDHPRGAGPNTAPIRVLASARDRAAAPHMAAVCRAIDYDSRFTLARNLSVTLGWLAECQIDYVTRPDGATADELAACDFHPAIRGANRVLMASR